MNINNLMKQAQSMQKKMAEMQKEQENKNYEGVSGGGSVKINVSGKYQINSIKLDPQVVDKDDIEMLEDLIVAAYNDAKSKIDSDSETDLSSMLNGFKLPNGMKFPF